MTYASPWPNRFALLVALSAAGCSKDKKEPPAAPPAAEPAPEPLPEPALSAAAPEPAPAPAAAKVDAVPVATLKEGLDVMVPRVLSQVDAVNKIAPNTHFRFFMHPAAQKNAAIEFNTRGLTSLAIAPYIEDLAGSDCIQDVKAGIVQLAWSLDNGKKSHITVDRTYNEVVNLDVAKSSRLTLEVDKGNDVTTCDWFSVGFVNVK